MKKLKGIRTFNTKVILLTRNNNYEYDINVDVIKSDSRTYNYRYYGFLLDIFFIIRLLSN